jgi:hypothetical protein
MAKAESIVIDNKIKYLPVMSNLASDKQEVYKPEKW